MFGAGESELKNGGPGTRGTSRGLGEGIRAAVGARSTGAAHLQRARSLLSKLADVEFEFMTLLGEIDALGLTDVVEGLAPSQWLSRAARCSMPAARRRVRAARALRCRIPDAAVELLQRGVVGFDHLVVLERLSNARIAEEWWAQSPELFEASVGVTFDAWEAEMLGRARELDQDGGHDPAGDLANNRLSVSKSDEFTLLSGQFVGDYAEVVRQAIEAEAQSLYRTMWADHKALGTEMPAGQTLRALALHALVRRGALVDDDGVLKPGAVEATLVVHQDGDDLRVFDEQGRLLSDSAVGRLMCDPSMVAVVLDSLGKPLDVGNRFRLATQHQRRALNARDGACTMPGCTATVRTSQAHHIRPFRLSRRTDIDNLLNLCPKCHGVVHRAGWSAELSADGWAIFTRPDGTRFWGQRQGRQREGPLPPSSGGTRSSP